MTGSLRRRYYLYSLTETQGLIAPVWVLLLQARGLSYTDIGFLGAVYWAVLVLAEIPTGYIGDRLGRRQSLLMAAVVTAVGIGGLAFAQTLGLSRLGLRSGQLGLRFGPGQPTRGSMMHSRSPVRRTPTPTSAVGAKHSS
nr:MULTISPECIES: MFS transporter [unclassified Natrinema]